MANKNRNHRNRWDDRDTDYRGDDRNRNWNRDNRQNTSMHQRNWNEGERSHDENYGLGDTSQGSANYGHEDDGSGARYYGTGNYGGYFGSGNDDDNDTKRHGERRGYDGRSEYFEDKNLNSRSQGNYERGPRYGNSNIHGRTHETGNYGGRPGYEGDAGLNSDRSYDGRGRNRDRNSGYNTGRGADWNQDRDWWDRTTDEVSSWFGDEDANHRREMDQRYGPHSGKGPKGYTRSDEKIKDDVEEKLYHDSFIDASDIEVSVDDGEVTLSGTVDHKQTRRRAEDCADAVAGVKDVSLNLKVNRTSGYGSSSEIGSLNSPNSDTLTSKDQKLDQSSDLNRTKNK